jgi:hypothetical protein
VWSASWEREDVCWSFGDEPAGDRCDDVRGGTETAGELLADECVGSARGVVMLEVAETGDGSWSAGDLGEDAALLWRVEFLRDDDDGWCG